MRFRFTLAAWGDWHLDQLARHGVPSLRALGNLDAVDYVISAHTRPADAERLRAALEGVNAELGAPIADGTGGDQATANGTIQGCAVQDVALAAAADEAWGMLAPDMVWSEGTFALYRRLLEAGNRAIFRPLLRVDADKAGTIREFGARHLAGLALDCEHAMGQLYRADAERFTTHAEAIIWPAPDGRVHQTISADIVLCVPSETAITAHGLAEDGWGRMAAVVDSDESVALAMTPADKEYEWQEGSAPLSPALVRDFLTRYPSGAGRGLAARPYRLHAGDTDPSSWAEAERRAAAFVGEVFDGMTATAPPVPPAPPPANRMLVQPARPTPPVLYDRVREGIMRGTLMR